MEGIIAAALALEKIETDKYGGADLFAISREKGAALAAELGADVNLVVLGTIFMDIKLGECLNEGKLAEHVARSAAAARDFLESQGADEQTIRIVTGAVENHHGAEIFPSREAEICANADCYKFLTPRGIFIYLTMLGKRDLGIAEALKQLESKMDEKFSVLSLDLCKGELDGYYRQFKDYIKKSL